MSTRTGWRAGEKLVLAWPRRRSRIGRTKAAVLPVPVCAAARTSRPARTSGMADSWTGVGDVYPSSATMRTRSADRPSESKVKRVAPVWSRRGTPWERDGGPAPRVDGRGRTVGRREHSGKAHHQGPGWHAVAIAGILR